MPTATGLFRRHVGLLLFVVWVGVAAVLQATATAGHLLIDEGLYELQVRASAWL